MMTPAQMQQWMQQWRVAEKGLAEQKTRELARLSEEKALAASYSLLSLASLAYQNPSRQQTSGLVEQQKWFRQWKG